MNREPAGDERASELTVSPSEPGAAIPATQPEPERQERPTLVLRPQLHWRAVGPALIVFALLLLAVGKVLLVPFALVFLAIGVPFLRSVLGAGGRLSRHRGATQPPQAPDGSARGGRRVPAAAHRIPDARGAPARLQDRAVLVDPADVAVAPSGRAAARAALRLVVRMARPRSLRDRLVPGRDVSTGARAAGSSVTSGYRSRRSRTSRSAPASPRGRRPARRPRARAPRLRATKVVTAFG